MALVGKLRLVVTVTGIELPQPVGPITADAFAAMICKQENFKVQLKTYLINEDGLRMTTPKDHVMEVGERFGYGPIIAELNVSTI